MLSDHIVPTFPAFLFRHCAVVLLAVLLAAGPVASAETDVGGVSGLPVPRFASLRSDETNLRTGPGVRYPVEWVLVLQGLPVEIVAEFGTWRRIRDPDGTIGWVHQSLLSGRRTAVVADARRTLRREAADTAAPVAYVEPGVIGRVLGCPEGPWCRVEAAGLSGWLRRDELWGVYPSERID